MVRVRRRVHGSYRAQRGAAASELPAHEEPHGDDTTGVFDHPGERRPERVAFVLPGEQLAVPRFVAPAERHVEQREDLGPVLGRRRTDIARVRTPSRHDRRWGRARRHAGELLVTGGQRVRHPADIEARRRRRGTLPTARNAGRGRRRRLPARRRGQPDRAGGTSSGVARSELLGDAADRGGHDRQAQRGGLHRGDRKPFPRRRQHEDIAGRHHGGGIRSEPGEHDVVAEAELVTEGLDLALQWSLTDGDQAERNSSIDEEPARRRGASGSPSEPESSPPCRSRARRRRARAPP